MFSLLVIAIIVLAIFHEFYWKRRGLPPGPTPLPIVGNLFQIFGKGAQHEYETYCKWRKLYGPVYTYWLGTRPVVAISEYKLVKDTIIKEGDKYAARFMNEEFLTLFRGGLYGVIFSNGDLWKDQRRFTLHTLRNFGMGRNLMEERIMVEVDYLLERIAKQKTDIFLQLEFDTSVGSIINNILFGYRFGEDRQEEFVFLKKSLQVFVEATSNPLFTLTTFVPALRECPPFKKVFNDILDTWKKLIEFFRDQIAHKRVSIDYSNETSEDFIECYLKEWKNREGKQNEHYCSDLQLESLVVDMWSAGMETTSNTLTWAFCYLLNYPEIQKKIHVELDRVIHTNRRITQTDKSQLHYMNAFIDEVQRLVNLLPQNLMRLTSEDVIVGSYHIPANTAIIPMISTILYDDEIFPEPYKFKPERFLSTDGTYKRREELVPFSVGKRQCIGEGMAKAELFLFVANIVQRFELTSTKTPSMVKRPGQVVRAEKYLCDVTERFAR